jgi:hypothetical protein
MQGTMRPLSIVELAPGFDLVSRVLHTQEPMLSEALLAQAPIEGFIEETSAAPWHSFPPAFLTTLPFPHPIIAS